MYVIRVNGDNNISTIVNQNIAQGYKLSDWFWIFSDQYYKDKDMTNCEATIEFILPESQEVISEKLLLKPDLYEGSVKYALSSKSKLTNESGIVKAKIKFINSSEEVIRETTYVSIGISTTYEWHDDTQFTPPSSDKDCLCDTDEHIEKLMERIRPLTFESVEAANTALNSGELKYMYLGQSVIIVNNGKYNLYSVQTKDGKYVADPVDTYGEGAVWNEED